MEIDPKYRRLAIMNLAAVAILGLVLRMKLTFPLPWVEHRYLLNAHSHFAFIGWAGYALILSVFAFHANGNAFTGFERKYLRIYQWNAWLMVPAFLFFGYAWPALVLLAVHIVLSLIFIWWWRKVRKSHNSVIRITIGWACFFNMLSFLGPLALAVMKIQHWGTAYDKQNAIYIFLHYQYNGYFLMMCLGIFSLKFREQMHTVRIKAGIILYIISMFFGIGLIWLMWTKPLWLQVMNMIVGAGILASAFLLAPPMMRAFYQIRNNIKPIIRTLWVLCMAGCVLKALLQAFSAIPDVAYLVYEHRSIAIGYLHLVFLIIVSFFLLGLMFINLPRIPRGIQTGMFIFSLGAIINEIFLSMQGMGAILNMVFPQTDLWLTAAAGLLALGGILMYLAQRQKNKIETQ